MNLGTTVFDDKSRELEIGDYVLATKYSDGDPKDHFAVGYYVGTLDRTVGTRYLVVDNDGNYFRANGFRRVRKISVNRGRWLVERLKTIEDGSHSVWWWARKSMAESTPFKHPSAP